MGADFLFNYVEAMPLDELDNDWAPAWQQYVANFTADQLAEIADDQQLDLDDDDPDLDAVRKRLLDAGLGLLQRGRGVDWISGIAGGRPVFVTGGMSWGGSPTEEFDDMCWVNAADNLRPLPWTEAARAGQ